MPIDDETARQIERFRQSLSANAPDMLAKFQPPVSEPHLDTLKRAIDPWVLPDAIETWLRFADGAWGVRFPIVESAFQSATSIAQSYRIGLEFGPPGLLPISYESHVQASVEMQQERPQAIYDTTVDGPDYTLIAPTFPSMLSAIVDLADEGYLDKNYPPGDLDWSKSASVNQRMNAIRDRWRASFAASDWSSAPFAPFEPFDHWGELPETGWGRVPEL